MENNNSEIVEQQIDDKLQLCEESPSSLKSLEHILYQMISNAVKELCSEYKTVKKNNSTPEDASRPKLFVSIQRPDEADIVNLALAVVDERKHFGRKIKNQVTGEKVVCFEIPEDFDPEGIDHIEEIKDRLGKWRIQRRQRNSTMKDTYYCHLASRQTCRSVPEVLNFVMYGPKQKRSASDIASSSQVDKSISSSEPPPLKNLMDMDLLEAFGEYNSVLGNTRFEDLLGESNDNALTHHQNQNFQESCGPAEQFLSLEESKQKLARVEVEVVTDDDHFHHGVHLSSLDPVNHLLYYDYDCYDDVIDALFRN